MQRGTVIVTAPKLGGKAHELLITGGFLPVYVGADITPTDFPAFVKKVQADNAPVLGLVVRSAKIDAEVIASLPDLKIISKHGVGVDSIDVDTAKAKGIAVTRTTGANARSVAELALGLMFACARHIVPYSNMIAGGQWDRTKWQGQELSRKTLGLIGFGQIGHELVNIAKPIFQRIIISDPYVDSKVIEALDAESVSLSELQQQADVLSLHCPLTADTKEMINAEFLGGMKAGSYLINAARGGVLDEQAVVDALDSGQLAGAGLDALVLERPEKSALRSHEKTVITPHIGGSTEQALETVAERAVSNVIDFVDGKALLPNDIVC